MSMLRAFNICARPRRVAWVERTRSAELIRATSRSSGVPMTESTRAYVHEPARRVPVVAEADVVVLGGGPAGLAAAASCARQGAATLLVERNGFRAERIDSIPTGIDAGRFRPGDRAAARARLGLPAEGILVGIAATLRSWKGHRYLVEAMQSLLSGSSNATTQRPYLLIVGDGPGRARDTHARQGQDPTIEPVKGCRFIGVGQLDVVLQRAASGQEQVAKWCRQCHPCGA